MTAPAPIFDVVIAGGGASGLALAAAIKQAMGQGASVAVVDPGSAAGGRGPLRTVAIADGPRRLLEQVGAWEAIEPKAQPILSMAIMDGDVRDAVRLPHLNFDAKDRAPLAHMAFNDDVVGALSALCDRLGVQRITASVAHWVARQACRGARPFRRARAARAPRGRRRRRALETRRLADIQTVGWDYDQTGIVATVAHERDHEGRAEQHFLPAGPFALLPLPGRQSSIVWNERRADAERAARARPRGSDAPARISLHAETGRDPPCLARRGFSVPLPDRAALRRPNGWRSSAMRRMSSIRSPGRV